jgi:hypothetical protein
MDQQEKEQALAAIADFERGGGVWRQGQARRLRKLLKKQPDKFWPEYFDTINRPDVEASVLVRTGAVNEQTTFGQMQEILTQGVHGQ